MWAFCKAVLAGAGRNSGLSVRRCAGGVMMRQAAMHVGSL